jgi:hypothetical protein
VRFVVIGQRDLTFTASGYSCTHGPFDMGRETTRFLRIESMILLTETMYLDCVVLDVAGEKALSWGLKGPWRPQPAWPQYASTLDRYNSMETDAIDAVIDAFESCGRTDHIYAAISMQISPGAIVTPNLAVYRPNQKITITRAILNRTTAGFGP